MASTHRALSLLAAVALAAGAVVILVTPEILAAPNPLAIPSAVVVAVGSGAAAVGGRIGRRLGLLVSVTGLVLSGLWLWLARDGFGLGGPWVDDMVEAATLAAAFVVATALLVLSEGPLRRARVAAWAVASGMVIVLGTALVVPVLADLPAPGPAPVSLSLPA